MTDAHASYRIRSPETWAAARDAYLAGESAESVCVRFDLGLSAFRKRAKAEGWRRVDQADPAPLDPDPDEDEDEDGEDDFDAADMARIAWRRVGRAIARGRSAEAARWLRLHEALAAPERAAARAEAQRRRADHDAADARVRAITHVARKLALDPALFHGPPTGSGGAEVDDVHDVHREIRPAPANRAERRRLARMGRASP